MDSNNLYAIRDIPDIDLIFANNKAFKIDYLARFSTEVSHNKVSFHLVSSLLPIELKKAIYTSSLVEIIIEHPGRRLADCSDCYWKEEYEGDFEIHMNYSVDCTEDPSSIYLTIKEK